MITIWHNPRCSKSRQANTLLEENGVEAEVYKYLDAEITEADVKDILKKLGMAPRELMRTKEAAYKELQLKDVKDDDVLIKAMVENPKLIERPIVVKGDKAVVGRPLEKVHALLNLGCVAKK